MNKYYDYNDKTAIKDSLPQLAEKIKLKQLELISIDRDLLNLRERLKVDEAKIMLEISNDVSLKNQAQRDAKLTIMADDSLQELKREILDLTTTKKQKEAELDYANTELRINFYYYKDIMSVISSEQEVE